MSGHSKWHNIKIKKSKVDAQKGKLFTKSAREIYMAVKESGPDPEVNYRLKLAIAKAKEINMPQDNIKRTIEKAKGSASGENYEQVTYEGYGPKGVAILVEAATDNRNRTASEIRNIFSKHSGNLGESGCVSWMFDKKGLITVPTNAISEDELLTLALESGAEDVKTIEGYYEMTTEPSQFHKLKNILDEKKISYESADITLIAKNTINLNENDAGPVLKLMEELESHDDIQKTYANFDIPQDVLEKLST